MKGAIAEAEAEKLREYPLTERVEISRNHRGPVIEVYPTDSVAQQGLYDIVENYQTWIEVMDPYA